MRHYQWINVNDIGAGVTIVFDNLVNMSVIVLVLSGMFHIPVDFILSHIIPGLALGIVLANTMLIALAFFIFKRSQKNNITAMSYGLDAPTCIGMSLLVVGPAFVSLKSHGLTENMAAIQAWHIGMLCVFFMGVVKVIFSVVASKIRSCLPTVGLLSSISGVGLALIAFFPLITVMRIPLISFFVFSILAMTYFSNYKIPFKFPGVLLAIVAGVIAYYSYMGFSTIPSIDKISFCMPILDLQFFSILKESIPYLPIAFSFGVLVVFGTISVAENARILGEDYSLRTLLTIDGIATIVASCFGATSQATVYAAYPAYVKMNARSGYLLINILVIGFGAWFGLIDFLIKVLPEGVLAPVLLVIGITVSSQVFRIIDLKHLPSAIIGIVPSIGRMVWIELNSNAGIAKSKLTSHIHQVHELYASQKAAIMMLGNGFIITGVLWATLIYYLTERRVAAAITTCFMLAILSFFGVIHSVLPNGAVYWPFSLESNSRNLVFTMSAAYLMFAFGILIMYTLDRLTNIIALRKCSNINLND